MRFGNDKTIIYVINSFENKEKNVQTLLVDIFGDKENEGLYGTKDEIDDGEDFFPYIYVPLIHFWEFFQSWMIVWILIELYLIN